MPAAMAPEETSTTCRPLIFALQEALNKLAPPTAVADDPADEFFPDDTETD